MSEFVVGDLLGKAMGKEAAKAKEREDQEKREKEKIAKYEKDIADAKQIGEAAVQSKNAEIVTLKADLATKDAQIKELTENLEKSSTPIPDTVKDQEIKRLTELVAKEASPIQPKIDNILIQLNDPSNTTVKHEKYTITKIDKGFQIILT